MANTSSKTSRLRRRKSVRKKVHGTTERPRLAVFRSSKHIYAQVIDDLRGVTVASASTLSPELKGSSFDSKREAASAVGRLVAEKAKAADVSAVVFDRGGFLYHGRVAALAAGARDGGLEF